MTALFSAPVVATYGSDDPAAPLVVLLHGRGSDEQDILGLAPHLPTGPAYTAVRAPIGEGGGFAWFANRGIGRPVAASLRDTMDWFRGWLDGAAPDGRPVMLVGYSGGAAFAGGLVLDDPRNKESKVRTKDQVISSIVGYKPQTHVSIEYIESLDDWKTAWDYIHFKGFLGVKMAMQFTWHGCDSILAAPLALDLARLALLSQRRGEVGVLRHLACFFKSPMGVAEHDFFKQFAMLESYVEEAVAQQVNR